MDTDTITPDSIPHATLKIIISIFILLLDLLILYHMFEIKFRAVHLLFLVPALGLYLILAFIMPVTRPVIWFFYSIRQFYRLGYCAFFFIHLNRIKDTPLYDRTDAYSLPIFAILCINFTILIEDGISISHLSSMLSETPLLTDRNFSENLLWMFISMYIVYVCAKQLKTISCKSAKFSDSLTDTDPSASIISSAGALYQSIPTLTTFYKFTPREVQILKYLISYKSNTEISEELCISMGTTKTHIHNIYAKVNVKNKNELVHALIDCVEEQTKAHTSL